LKLACGESNNYFWSVIKITMQLSANSFYNKVKRG